MTGTYHSGSWRGFEGEGRGEGKRKARSGRKSRRGAAPVGRGRRGRASPALPRSTAGSAQRVRRRRLGSALSPAPAMVGSETPHRASRAGRTPLKSGRYLA